ncbi:selenoprotein N isoform X1 [Sarcophilus harrisii]|uniref:EF-hand domain-containing protein n=1 Tax=Sarcophilus harrisii TaxID=9305 RepID=A0A7N4UYR7_SARHA|nr:selenoprotein N isoform X1 [Sarcophilus harrisii]
MDLAESPGPSAPRLPPPPPGRPPRPPRRSRRPLRRGLPGRPRRPQDLALLAAVLGALLAVATRSFVGFREFQAEALREAAQKFLGEDGFSLFSSLDRDRDMYINPEEFKRDAKRLIAATSISILEEEVSQNSPLDLSEEKFSIMARFQPLLPKTMYKSKDGFLHVSHLTLSGLRNWTVPDVVLHLFSAQKFFIFLPPKEDLKLGEPWWIIPNEVKHLPSTRFYPPRSKRKEDLIFKLLSMFHPRLFVKTRFGPRGTVACLMAISDLYYTVAFRIHAEFQLNEPPLFPFWFSPGQFTGHIILSKDSSHVRDFKLFVPNHKPLNVEMDWLYQGEENGNPKTKMNMDIGYLPQMELESWGPSGSTEIHKKGKITYRRPSEQSSQFVFEDIVWQKEISWEKAVQRLKVAMYPFLKVTYLPLIKAFERARIEKKLVHSIVLWGSLDDQSCFGPGKCLRDKVLGNPFILMLLRKNFISSWSQVHELIEIQNQDNKSHKKLAELLLEKYSDHVMILLCLPNGTVVHHISANELCQVSKESSGKQLNSVTMYEQFLQKGLSQAQPFLQRKLGGFF